ncbi:hypothetical protein EAG_01802 [Camponotus floridanus]|uniref:Uncharacterized protein n=1 Tax=Camponotus floridanus TaxID=104421 RepID=E2AIE9_CAMFO|nr:hypothetical protein EAG_01802 [Camponotus floridanus]
MDCVDFQDEVETSDFVNIQRRQWVLTVRRIIREVFLDMWRDTPESPQVKDIFDLRRLFKEESYIDIIEKELERIIEEEHEQKREEEEQEDEEEKEREEEEQEKREEEQEEDEEDEKREEFDEKLEIYSMFSDDNEEIMMKEFISTAAARGCVERWLIQTILYENTLLKNYQDAFFKMGHHGQGDWLLEGEASLKIFNWLNPLARDLTLFSRGYAGDHGAYRLYLASGQKTRILSLRYGERQRTVSNVLGNTESRTGVLSTGPNIRTAQKRRRHPVKSDSTSTRQGEASKTGHPNNSVEPPEGHVKVSSYFLNGTPYMLLLIFVAHLKSFPKHYNYGVGNYIQIDLVWERGGGSEIFDPDCGRGKLPPEGADLQKQYVVREPINEEQRLILTISSNGIKNKIKETTRREFRAVGPYKYATLIIYTESRRSFGCGFNYTKSNSYRIRPNTNRDIYNAYFTNARTVLPDADRGETRGGRVQRGTDTGLTGSANRGQLRTGEPVFLVTYTGAPWYVGILDYYSAKGREICRTGGAVDVQETWVRLSSRSCGGSLRYRRSGCPPGVTAAVVPQDASRTVRTSVETDRVREPRTLDRIVRGLTEGFWKSEAADRARLRPCSGPKARMEEELGRLRLPRTCVTFLPSRAFEISCHKSAIFRLPRAAKGSLLQLIFTELS